jgi:hypothetical protein
MTISEVHYRAHKNRRKIKLKQILNVDLMLGRSCAKESSLCSSRHSRSQIASHVFDLVAVVGEKEQKQGK